MMIPEEGPGPLVDCSSEGTGYHFGLWGEEVSQREYHLNGPGV
jgi:hypothetical protein